MTPAPLSGGGDAPPAAPPHVHGHDICRVQVDPCEFPVDAKVIHQKPNGPKEIRAEFLVRVANGTKALDVLEREKYVLSRWAPLHRPPAIGVVLR